MAVTAIGGGPRTGKTTLANSFFDVTGIRHTDDLIESGTWQENVRIVSSWLDDPGRLIVEGVLVAPALLHRMEKEFKAPGIARLIWLHTPQIPLTPGQQRMHKAQQTIFHKLFYWLERFEVEIDQRRG